MASASLLQIRSDYELRRDQLLTQPEPGAFSEEVLSGFKNKFGKFFGTDHLLLEGWCSYAAHLEAKPDDDGIEICFYSGAMAMFKTMLEFSTSDKEEALKRLGSGPGPDELWDEYRACLASEISSEILDQYKKAFYGGGWFIDATFMTMANKEEQYLRGMEALRDEISDFRTNIKQSALAALGGPIIASQKEYLERDHGSKDEKLEFVLRLSEALAQVSSQPTPDILEMMASTFLIPLEYKMIEGISCPKCLGRSLQEIRRGSLNPRKGFDWPYNCPGGDEYHFRCSTCAHSFPVTFWFTK
jgi:hypothetical protein